MMRTRNIVTLYKLYKEMRTLEQAFENAHFEDRKKTHKRFYEAFDFSCECDKVFKKMNKAYTSHLITWEQFDWLTKKNFSINDRAIDFMTIA